MADALKTKMMVDKEKEDSVMKTMVLFCLSMIFFPVFLYFFTKRAFFEAIMGMSSQDSYFYAAFIAIGAIHIILGAFVYKAFKEGSSTPTKVD